MVCFVDAVMRGVNCWPKQEFVDCFPRAYASPRQLMPATALIRLNEVTNELMELARASRANKVRSHTLVAGRGDLMPQLTQGHGCGYLAASCCDAASPWTA